MVENIQFSRLGDQAQNQRRDAKREGTTVPRYVFEFEVDVPEVGSSVLELFDRSIEQRKHDPPFIGTARPKVGQFRNDLWMCFIADGVHVPFVALGNYLGLVGPERAIVVTDATAASAAGPGRYTLGRREILVGDDGVPRSAGFSQLVGSGVTMKNSRQHLLADLHCLESMVLALMSQNPRRAIGAGEGQAREDSESSSAVVRQAHHAAARGGGAPRATNE